MTPAEKLDQRSWARSPHGTIFRAALVEEISACDRSIRTLARQVTAESADELKIWAVRKGAVQDILDWFDDPESNLRNQN